MAKNQGVDLKMFPGYDFEGLSTPRVVRPSYSPTGEKPFAPILQVVEVGQSSY